MLLYKSERMDFRRMIREDITETFVAELNDKDLLRYSNQRFFSHTIASQQEYLDSFESTRNEYIGGFFRPSSTLAVTLTFFTNPFHQTTDVGILVRSGSKGLGIGLEAYEASVRYLFENTSVRKITGGTLRVNVAMVKIFERLGFQLEGVRVGQELIGSEEVDQLLYGKFNG